MRIGVFKRIVWRLRSEKVEGVFWGRFKGGILRVCFGEKIVLGRIEFGWLLEGLNFWLIWKL